LPTNSVSANQNGSASIASSVVGAPPFTYQWYYVNTGNGSTNVVTGATNGTLTLTDIQAVQGQYNYFVVVSNTYGASTSSVATLNISSGPPTVQVDISPLLVQVPAGVPVSFSVTVIGTAPFAYQWSSQAGPIAGATDSSYTFDVLPGTNSYSVTITNASGSASSSTAVVVGLTTAPPVIAFSDDGSGWTLNDGSGDPATMTNGVLQLTDGTGGENTSAFFDTAQYIGGFIASFVYHEAPGNAPLADGVTFCIQNSGLTSVGGGGGELGYTGITSSAALELNIYSGDHGGDGYLIGTDGNTPDSDGALGNFLSTSPVNLTSGDPIQVGLYYNGSVLALTLVDSKAGASFSTSTSLPNLPTVVGGATAYVGFTGACGGLNAIQSISNFVFSYTTPPTLSIAHGGTPGSVVITWPVSVSTLFALQQSSKVDGPWTNVSEAPVVVNSENQVTLTPGTSTAFYRLSFQ
jgi:hypothetical protein